MTTEQIIIIHLLLILSVSIGYWAGKNRDEL